MDSWDRRARFIALFLISQFCVSELHSKTSLGVVFTVKMISYWPFSTKTLFVQVRFVMLMHVPSVFSIYQIQTRSAGGLTGSMPTELHDSFSLVLGKMEAPPKKKKAQKFMCWGNRVQTPGMLSLLGLAGPEGEMSQQDKTGELLRATDFPNWYLSIDQHISKE